jgi:arylsulfatase A-like enzyme
MLTRRSALRTLAATPLLAAQAAARKPNLLIILADDMGYGDIACYGSPDVPTPHIDSLASGGTRFTDGYVSCAVCSPSRVALLTGRYQQRFGHEFNSGPPEREAQVNFGLPADARILPQYLKPHGYRSAVIGKWHLGIRPGYHPLDRGFDEFYGFLTGGNAFITKRTPGARAVGADGAGPNIPERRRDPLFRNRETVIEDRYLTEAFGDEAVRFIDRNHANPFFLYLSFNAIHTPLHATERYLDRFIGIKNEKHRMLAAMTAALDDAVGAVMAKLRERGIDKDTLVFFLSDNGCPVMTGAGTNGPLNGEKVTYYEGGIRVLYREPVVSRDIVPTFLSAADARPRDTNFDGVDLLPYLSGRSQGMPHDALFWRGGQGRAVRMGNWKLVEFGERYSRLYDLAKDLGEKVDLSSRHPEQVRRLREAWRAWSAQMKPAAWPPRYREVTINGEMINWEL